MAFEAADPGEVSAVTVSVLEHHLALFAASPSRVAESGAGLPRARCRERRLVGSGRLRTELIPVHPRCSVLLEGSPGPIRPADEDPSWGAPAAGEHDVEVQGTAGMRLREALRGVGLDGDAVEAWARAAQAHGALVRRETADPGPDADDVDSGGRGVDEAGCTGLTRAAVPVLEGVGHLVELGGRMDAAVLELVRDLTARHGRILLAGKGATDPGELSSGQRERWRARAKSLTRAEVEALTGWGTGEVADLVGLANAPAAVSAVVASGMRGGVAPWRLARRFWRDCSALAHEDAAVVANTLFGFEVDTVAPERLTPEGELDGGPWRHREFYRALEREVAKIRGRDPEERRAERARAHARRDARATIGEDGTGCVVITGSAVQVAAILDRLETAARRARKFGDPRTLAQLRADIALSLLLHGKLGLPDLPEDPDQVTVEHTAALAKVLGAMPAAALQVIVPYSTLHYPPGGQETGGEQQLRFEPGRPGRSTDDAAWPQPPPGHAPPRAGPPGGRPSSGSSPPVPGSDTPSDQHDPPSESGPSGRGSAFWPDPTPGQACEGGGPPSEVLAVGQVSGALPVFLTPDVVRELVLVPGSTLHRLLVDPATGRCVERSITAYRPDAAMRAQVLAADVTCRWPGCVREGSVAQFDHVHEFDQGGPTAETNIQLVHPRDHQLKTAKFWDAVMDQSRTVTWTSLLGKIYRTRAHDYRQYTTWHSQAVAAAEAAGAPARAEAVNQAIYTALAHRRPTGLLQSEDDDGFDLDLRFLGWDALTLTHHDQEGRLRNGPPLHQVRAPRRSDQRDRACAQPREPDRTSSPGQDPDEPVRPVGMTDLQDGSSKQSQTSSRWGPPDDDDPPPF